MTTAFRDAGPDQCIIWADVETNGLDPKSNCLLEIACVLTDKNLNILGSIERVIFPPRTGEIVRIDKAYKEADPVVQEMHTGNGLWEAVAREGASLAVVEKQLDTWLKDNLAAYGVFEPTPCILGGASVDFDKAFIREHLPEFYKNLHYRVFDVSVLKRMAEWWLSDVYKALPPAEGAAAHRAMPDILHTIEEARHLKNLVTGTANR